MSAVYLLTSDQIEIQNMARDFASREILGARTVHEMDALAKNQLIEKICRAGLINTRIPVELSGPGLSLAETCLIIEELAFVSADIASLAQASELAVTYVLRAGSQEQKSRFLRPLAEHGALAGIAPLNYLTGNFHKQLIAKQEAGKIFLNGECPLVLNAQIAKWFLVACPVVQNSCNKNNVTIAYFIIPKDIEGLGLSGPIEHIGCQFTDARAASFKNVTLDSIARIDFARSHLDESIALGDAGDILNSINPAIISAGCLGLANAAFAEAKNYAQERKTFGAPIAKHQVVSFMLADMITDIEALRSMIHQIIKSTGHGCNNKKLAINTQIFALQMIGRITIDAVQILGGYGYTRDYPVEKFMRDAKAYQSFYGIENSNKPNKENLPLSFV